MQQLQMFLAVFNVFFSSTFFLHHYGIICVYLTGSCVIPERTEQTAQLYRSAGERLLIGSNLFAFWTT